MLELQMQMIISLRSFTIMVKMTKEHGVTIIIDKFKAQVEEEAIAEVTREYSFRREIMWCKKKTVLSKRRLYQHKYIV